jgi:hypothetical protein
VLNDRQEYLHEKADRRKLRQGSASCA